MKGEKTNFKRENQPQPGAWNGTSKYDWHAGMVTRWVHKIEEADTKGGRKAICRGAKTLRGSSPGQGKKQRNTSGR